MERLHIADRDNLDEDDLKIDTNGQYDEFFDHQAVQFNLTYEAFGLVLDFLSRTPPFGDYDLKTLSEAIRRQLHLGHHLVALRERSIVGYAGWLLTTEEVGEAWLEGRGRLAPVAPEYSNAAALTTVAVSDRAAVMPLVRGARDRNPNMRAFFKRDGEHGARKSVVLNRTAATRA